jgi:AraC-like DNA-binding protein
MSNFVHITSIAEVHRLYGLGKPLHPLLSISWHQPARQFHFGDTKFTSDVYLISLKGNIRGTFAYGRSTYDFEEGTLVFMAPGQVTSFGTAGMEVDGAGWSIVFHPDLIRKSPLSNLARDYAFFQYAVHEALHLSEKEKDTLTDLVRQMDSEIQQNTDKHSQGLILVLLETVIKYCHRYYDRQFYTRTNLNRDIIARFEAYLETYFASEALQNHGLPTITQCGEALSLSGPYLSDLLRIETGKSALAHIHSYVIEQSKTLLLNSNASVSDVAYRLGFKYPQHFSKLFKARTGFNPSDYRHRP